jgi:enoyl-CoA hydratase/carnithine racemase
MSSESSVSPAGGSPVLVQKQDRVLLVTLNRPSKLNAIDEGLSRGLGEALERAETDDDINAVVLSGNGRAFCAGMDLNAFRNGDPIVHPDRPEWGVAGIVNHPISVPIIAAVHGVAAGGGFEIALCADLIVADEAARFALPEIKLGLFAAGGGLLRLPGRMPPHLANELALTGRFASCDEMATWGIVNRVAPDGQAVTQALRIGQQIASNAPQSVRATKRLLGLARQSSADSAEGWRLNAKLMEEVFHSQDAKEGVEAFAAGRAPRWTGR